MKIVVGLGNPGGRYEAARHNTGFMVLDQLADRWQKEFKKKEQQALVCEGRFGGQKILLAKPLTYMNLSGVAVAALVRFYKLTLEELLVVYDDLDLEPGRLRFRPGGSGGGHKGLASIQELLAESDIQRLKVGIGRPPAGWEVKDYVLAPFTEGQWQVMREVLPRAAEAVEDWLENGIIHAMNNYNN